jgi:predicted nucleotidyltransferase
LLYDVKFDASTKGTDKFVKTGEKKFDSFIDISVASDEREILSRLNVIANKLKKIFSIESIN